ncbi:MAG: tetratricopeptide repeat protein [Planctomycetota bacterium]
MTPVPPAPPRSSPLVLGGGLVLVLLAVLAVYWPALKGERVYDDLLLVGRNPLITDLGNLPAILASPYWGGIEAEDAAQIGYWRPLTGLAHAVSWALGGGAPWAFHGLGIAVHLAATAAAFALARRLTGRPGIALATALVFGLHPLHVESVAWISALNDPLFGLFALLASTAHLRWRERGSRGIPLAGAIAFALALGAKELGAAVLPLLAALELGRRRTAAEPAGLLGGFHAPIRAYLPYGIVLALYFVARIFVFGSVWAGFERVTTDFGVGAERLATLRLEILGGSLELLVWPLDLRLFRPFRPTLPLGSGDLLRAILWTAAAAGVAIFLLWRRARTGLAAILIVPAGLLPVLFRVESLGSFPLSDRFLYVPVFGFGLALALVLARLLSARVTAAAVVAIALLYAIQSRERIATWHDEDVLFRTAARETPRSPYVLWGRGRVLLEEVARTGDRHRLAEAREVYERAGTLLEEAKRPGSDLYASSRDFLQVNLGLAWCTLFEAKLEGAQSYEVPIAIFQKLAEEIEGIQRRTREVEASGIRVQSEHLELEQVYTGLGAAHLMAGHLDAAERSLAAALAHRPGYPEASHNLGLVYQKRGELPRARACFEAALARRPGSYEDRLEIARCHFQEGDLAAAAAQARELGADFPGEAEPRVILASVALAGGDWRGALGWVERALVLDPHHGYAWYHRANALLLKARAEGGPSHGARGEIVEALRRAAEALPSNVEVQYQLGAYLLGIGAVEAAVPALRRAYEVGTDEDLLDRLAGALQGLPSPSPDLFCALARIDARRGRLGRAEAWLEAALALDPACAEALRQRAELRRPPAPDEASPDPPERDGGG